jgi:hypothetical protein
VISVQAIVISLESSQIRWNHNLLKSLTSFSVRLLELVQAAKADPTPNRISKVTTAIRQAGEIVLAGSAIWEIGHVILKLAGLG